MHGPVFDPADAAQRRSLLQWQQFAATGSVYDYLEYLGQRSRLDGGQGKANYADSNDRSGAAPGKGGRGGPDLDAVDP